MALWEKVLDLKMMREKVTYGGHKICARFKKGNNCYYVFENGGILPIAVDSGKFVHIMHMEKGFPIDTSRDVFLESGWAIDEEQLQICINEEYIKQIEAEAKT
jgi:hypothetical protein